MEKEGGVIPMVDRVFDVEFSPVELDIVRDPEVTLPTSCVWTMRGDNGDLLYDNGRGKAIFYHQLDLSELTADSRTFQPVAINVQRNFNGPQGIDANFMPSTRPTELLYIFSNQLPNQQIRDGDIDIDVFRDLGLDAAAQYGIKDIPPFTLALKVVPDGSNTIFAQSTRYVNSISNSTNAWNGFAYPGDPSTVPPTLPDTYYPLLCQDMSVTEVNTWGEMRTILGPQLHCYRVIFHETQNMSGLSQANPLVIAQGITARKFSTLCIKILCREDTLSEGEYLVEAANAYNNSNWDAPSEV